jgi:hypothetical protein
MSTLHTLYVIALLTCTPFAFAMDDNDSSRSSSPDQSLYLHNQPTTSYNFHPDNSDSDDDVPATTNNQPTHTSRNIQSSASYRPFPQLRVPFPEIIPDLNLPKPELERQTYELILEKLANDCKKTTLAAMMIGNLFTIDQILDEMLAAHAQDVAQDETLTDISSLFQEQSLSDNSEQPPADNTLNPLFDPACQKTVVKKNETE